MRKRIFLLVFMLSAFGIALGATAETPVIGFIAQDTTWTQANSPYVTLGNIIVKEGVTLTIEPGVTVQFDFGHSLTIEGRLLARGTDKQRIKLTPKGDKKPGAWGGIVFENSSIDAKFDDAGNYVSGTILQYCTVEFAKTAVKANSASPFIDHCVISNNASGGISISKGDIVIIRDSTVADNEDCGISVGYSKNVTLTGNILTGNRADFGGGINVTGGTATISNNTLTGNRADFYGGGIYVDGGTATISNNTLTGNRADFGGGIRVGGVTATISNNTLTGNRADFGGGIYVDSGTATISNNTITENRISGSDGAAIYYESDEGITGNFIANNILKEVKIPALFTLKAIPRLWGMRLSAIRQNIIFTTTNVKIPPI